MNYKMVYDSIIEKRRIIFPESYSEVHHIVPRSLGGSDDKSNLVRLTAREHFVCHLLLTKIYTNKFENAKMIRAFLMMFSCSKNQQRYITSRTYSKLRQQHAINQREVQLGENNSQYGTKWIYSIELRECKKISKKDVVPDGWAEGRILDFTKHEIKTKVKTETDIEKLLLIQSKDAEEKIVKLQKDKQKEIETATKIKKYSEWYEIYRKVGFSEFCKITNYDKSIENLVQNFSRNVPHFKPQNGKKRGK